MISPSIGYRVEGVSTSKDSSDHTLSRVQNSSSIKVYGRDDLPQDYLEGVFDITDADNDFLYYRDDIRGNISEGQAQFELLCSDSSNGPVSVSIRRSGQIFALLLRLDKVRSRSDVLSV